MLALAVAVASIAVVMFADRVKARSPRPTCCSGGRDDFRRPPIARDRFAQTAAAMGLKVTGVVPLRQHDQCRGQGRSFSNARQSVLADVRRLPRLSLRGHTGGA